MTTTDVATLSWTEVQRIVRNYDGPHYEEANGEDADGYTIACACGQQFNDSDNDHDRAEELLVRHIASVALAEPAHAYTAGNLDEDVTSRKRVRMGDACGPEHTYRDACQYAWETK